MRKTQPTQQIIQYKVLALKNKHKTYLLLLAVLGIWGTIAVKIVNGLSDSEDIVVDVTQTFDFKPDSFKPKRTFTIDSFDRDPFLGTIKNPKTRASKKVVSSSRDSISKPHIRYHGSIKRQGNNETVFTLSINNQQHLLKIGQRIDDYRLVRGNANEILIGYKNHKFRFNRE